MRNPVKTSFTFFSFLFGNIFFIVSITLAADTEKAHTSEAVSRNSEAYLPYSDSALQEEFEAECLWLACDETVSIATRRETPISKAPSIITVITAEEIKNLGYRTLSDILRILPGFEFIKTSSYGVVSPIVRGLQGAEKVKVLLNGHLVNTPTDGSVFDRFDDFPIENIKKIEVIRGPGSALYGESALLAVINILTFDAKDIDGVKVTSGYGSFDTYEENIVFGKIFGKVEISGMFHYRQTEGFDGTIKSDGQTILDEAYGTDASMAPGKVHDGRQEFDINLKMVYQNFYVEGWYLNKDREPFVGPRAALNDETDIETNSLFCEAGYKNTFEEKFTLKPRIYYDQFDNNSFLEFYPENTRLFVDSDSNGVPDTFYTYTDGLLASVKGIQRVAGAEIAFDYDIFDGNTVTLGTEYRYIKQSDTHFSSNYNPFSRKPLESLQDFTDSYGFYPDATRKIWSIYLQDTWDITDTINLTLGIRHDEYNDFGNAISPKAGLTWAFIKNASLKFLYGEAFRPPSLFELRNVTFGNEDLDAETIRTYDLGLSYRFNKYVTSSINYFYNDVKDLIQVTFTQNKLSYENVTNAHIQGVEMETKVDIAKGNYLFMNYTFQDPEDNHGNDLPFTAKHKGNFGVNVHYWKYINTNLSTFVSGKRTREEGDTRDDLPAYALLNLSVIGREFFKTMEVQGTVYNLLDKDYNDPGPASIPDDLPRPGRTFFVSLSYQF